MRNTLCARWLIMSALITGLQTANARGVINQHQKAEKCLNMVYLDTPNGADLKERPSDKSRTVMKLQYMQYLCVIKDGDVKPER